MPMVPSMTTLLRRATADIERGVAEIMRWKDESGAALVELTDPDFAADGVGFYSPIAPPEDAANDIADGLKKLRDALDHLAWDAWTRSGGSRQARVYFPIASDSEKFAKSDLFRQVQPAVQSIFLRAQQVERDTGVLARLNGFANAAKHKEPVVAAIPSKEVTGIMRTTGDGLAVAISFPLGGSILPGVPHPLVWVLWHEINDSPTIVPPTLRRDDPRLPDPLEFPQLNVTAAIGVRCDAVQLTLDQVRDTLSCVSAVASDYEATA